MELWKWARGPPNEKGLKIMQTIFKTHTESKVDGVSKENTLSVDTAADLLAVVTLINVDVGRPAEVTTMVLDKFQVRQLAQALMVFAGE